MVYITGDTHGDYDIFKIKSFRYNFKDGDTLIICGDFGGVWYPEDSDFKRNTEDNLIIGFYTSLPIDVCFIDGNHENYDRLYKYPIVDYKGGKAHKITDNVYHLIRGEVFTIEGQTFLAMGGACSHDIQDGVLEIDDPRIIEWSKDRYKMFRINHLSWWKEEVPSEEERNHCLETLKKYNYEVDCILTHEAPTDFLYRISRYLRCGRLEIHEYSNWLETLRRTVSYKAWCFGHYHIDIEVSKNERCFYNEIRGVKNGCLVYRVDSDQSEI